MKFLADLFPVILFFGTFSLARQTPLAESAIYIATAVAIAATVAQVAYAWFRHRKVETMQWVSLGLIVVLGGATLLLHDKSFIMWKPTVLYWLMGSTLLVMNLLGKQPLNRLMGQQLTLPAAVWQRLTYAWVVFFAVMGGLNLYVAFNFSETIWVNFKLFGGMGLMFAFVLAQGLFLSRYMEDKS